jgi:hypothetical protein
LPGPRFGALHLNTTALRRCANHEDNRVWCVVHSSPHLHLGQIERKCAADPGSTPGTRMAGASKGFIFLEGTEPFLFQLLNPTPRNSSFSGLNSIQFNSVQPIATLHLSCSSPSSRIPPSQPKVCMIHCHESGGVRGAQRHLIDHESRSCASGFDSRHPNVAGARCFILIGGLMEVNFGFSYPHPF